MLTVDDCNSILEKYGDRGFWYEIDFNKLEIDKGKRYWYDFCYIEFPSNRTDLVTITINQLWGRQFYFKNASGEIVNGRVNGYDFEQSMIQIYLPEDNDLIFCVFMNRNKVSSSFNYVTWMFMPLSDLVIPVVNGEFDDKLYIKGVGRESGVYPYHVNGEIVSLEEDENGTFLRLPSTEDCWIGVVLPNPTRVINYYKVIFNKFKSLPIPYIPTLYKGTPQSIQVLNSEDDDPISDYQTYYQGRQLKDNTIRLPYDADDYINIIVDLKDYRYPFATVKLKAPTVIYQANSQSDVETAIENGIQTLQVGDNQNEVTLNSIELSNVTLINSNIQVSESILTDCQIIDSTYTDNGGNTVTSTIFKDTDYTTTAQSNYNEVTFTECTIHDSEINLTGTITDCTITDTLIISDGVINIQDNTFTGVGLKEYFPSHLYLTGDYTVTGNIFNLTGEWEELEYNMCIIKSTNTFNPGDFINKNNFNLNITYEDEQTNTLYYNIVDEDKIRAVRL